MSSATLFQSCAHSCCPWIATRAARSCASVAIGCHSTYSSCNLHGQYVGLSHWRASCSASRTLSFDHWLPLCVYHAESTCCASWMNACSLSPYCSIGVSSSFARIRHDYSPCRVGTCQHSLDYRSFSLCLTFSHADPSCGSFIASLSVQDTSSP